jgi:hypothetical protein
MAYDERFLSPANVESLHVVGRDTAMTAVSAGRGVIISEITGTTFATAAASADWTVVSTSASDAAAGTGARTLYIRGIDSAGDYLTETVILNGITPVAVVGTYKRVLEAYVATVGSGGVAVGTITILQTTVERHRIVIGYDTLLTAAWYVPAGKVGLIDRWDFNMASSNTGIAEAQLITSTNGTIGPRKVIDVLDIYVGAFTFREYATPIVVAENTDIFVYGYDNVVNVATTAFDIRIVRA